MPVLAATHRRLFVELAAPVGLEAAMPKEAGWKFTDAAVMPASLHPWDEAHRAVANPAVVGLKAATPVVYAEPELVQRFPYRGVEDVSLESLADAAPCQFTGPDPDWPMAEGRFAWHLGKTFSGLAEARTQVGDPSGRRVRIGILDTGYDPEHVTRPVHLNTALQHNFAGGPPDDATDPGRHFPLNNPGHGTATLALLAGNRVQSRDGTFKDFLGGAPFAEVVPIRIADSVIHFYSSAMAAGLEYAIAIGCEVVSISMGGLPTRAWATAVNRAYEAGVAIFAAAGNRIGPSPPRWIIYPARFGRVVAVCGATADKTPYFKPGLHRKMQGCFGPPAKMQTALTAYTPNTPWAAMGCAGLVNQDGNGTSSATPQAAAAAALWLQQAHIPTGIEPWQKVEAVRHALFVSADKSRPDTPEYFGQGLLRAAEALKVPFRTDLPKIPADAVSFPWLRMLGGLEAISLPSDREQMYEVEALQIYEQSPQLQQITLGADPRTDPLDPATAQLLATALQQSPLASQALKAHLAMWTADRPTATLVGRL